MEAAKEVHGIVEFRESDFPNKALRFMAGIASDPTINPDADRAFRENPLREMMRDSRLPEGCPASDRQ